MSSTTAIRPASTVVLLRDRGALEVFLVRRHDRIAFMGGAHVFPGGRVDGSDDVDVVGDVSTGLDAAASAIPDTPRHVAIAFHAAAVRELFEEAGILLARRDGTMVAIDDASAATFAEYRRQITDGQIDLRDIAHAERVSVSLDALTYLAHWVTPERETRRYDTRFFLAVAPEGQDAAHCARETTDGSWMTPSDAIARCLGGEIALPPPTWTTLRQIERHRDTDSVIAWARSRAVPRVQPEMIERGDERIIALPGDPLHPAREPLDTPERRFRLANGRWTPISPRDPL